MKHSNHTPNSKEAELACLVRRKEIASILGAAIVRKRLRDVRNGLKKNGNSERSLEVSFGQSVHRLEPEHEGERH